MRFFYPTSQELPEMCCSCSLVFAWATFCGPYSVKPTLNLFIAAKQNCQSPCLWRLITETSALLPAIDLVIESQTLWSFGDLNGEYLRKPITAIPRTFSFSSRLQHVPSPQHQWLNLRRTSCSKGSNGYLQGCICNIFWIVFLHVCVPLSILLHSFEWDGNWTSNLLISPSVQSHVMRGDRFAQSTASGPYEYQTVLASDVYTET